MTRTKWQYARLGLALITIGLASATGMGCAARQDPGALAQARTAYRQAEQEPDIVKHAPVALREAEQALQRAERTWSQEKDEQEVQHLAQLTTQRVEIARSLAQQRATEAAIEQLGTERDIVLREAREREAQRAQQEAARAQQEAAQAQQRATQARQQATQATARATQLEQELAALKAKETERGLVLTLGDVLFATGQATLRSGALRNLYTLVTFLRENPNSQVSIEGHTDSVGSDSFNLDLSQRRAEAVMNFLVQNGIPSTQLTARGLGEGYPVASNDTETGRQQNRRVEVVVMR